MTNDAGETPKVIKDLLKYKVLLINFAHKALLKSNFAFNYGNVY